MLLLMKITVFFVSRSGGLFLIGGGHGVLSFAVGEGGGHGAVKL